MSIIYYTYLTRATNTLQSVSARSLDPYHAFTLNHTIIHTRIITRHYSTDGKSTRHRVVMHWARTAERPAENASLLARCFVIKVLISDELEQGRVQKISQEGAIRNQEALHHPTCSNPILPPLSGSLKNIIFF